MYFRSVFFTVLIGAILLVMVPVRWLGSVMIWILMEIGLYDASSSYFVDIDYFVAGVLLYVYVMGVVCVCLLEQEKGGRLGIKI